MRITAIIIDIISIISFVEKILLLRYLKTYNYNLEKAQKLLQYSFELRAENKHIFTKRDVHSPEIENVLKTWYVNEKKITDVQGQKLVMTMTLYKFLILVK